MKTLKIFTAFLLALTLAVTTVICCCIAPVVMSHVHKAAAACQGCQPQHPAQGHSSSTTDNCIYHLSNAEIIGQMAIAPAPIVFSSFHLYNQHIARPFLLSSIQAYPRGSPPLIASFTPLYLRTFNLRI